jgi:hypothetical protein
MAKNFGQVLRLAPFRWIGAAPGYSDAFNTFIKSDAVPVRAWDRITRVWWFPEHYEPAVREKLLELRLIHPDAASNWIRQVHFNATKDGDVDSRRNALKTLGLDPDSNPPRDFVRQAYGYWKQQYLQTGAFTRLQRLEEAYKLLEDFCDLSIMAADAGSGVDASNRQQAASEGVASEGAE